MGARSDAHKHFNIAIGALLTHYLADTGVKQKQLSRWLSITQGCVSRLLNGKQGFDCWQLRTVALKLGLSLDALYEDAGRVTTQVLQAQKTTKLDGGLKLHTLFAAIVAKDIAIHRKGPP